MQKVCVCVRARMCLETVLAFCVKKINCSIKMKGRPKALTGKTGQAIRKVVTVKFHIGQ